MFHRKWNFIFENIAGIPSSYQERWQAYLVPNKTDMASMFGSLLYQHDKHTFPIYSLKKIVEDVGTHMRLRAGLLVVKLIY